MLLPAKRRLEVRDKETSDLLMIHASDGSVDSRDVEISNTIDNSWQVEGWGLNIQLIELVGDSVLVDLFDNAGSRVLCMLV